MKCSVCKVNEAVIHIREYTKNSINKINLCLECALEKGFNATINDINKLFRNLIKNIFNIKENHNKIEYDNIANELNLACPNCKTSYNKVLEESKVGCPTCYSAFDQMIDYIIYKNNNSLYYRGKLPEYLKKVKNNRAILLKLKKELKKNINSEDFSNAALIRDKIKEIKKEIEKGVRRIAK